MDLLLTGIKQAFWLLLSGDPEVWRITFLSPTNFPLRDADQSSPGHSFWRAVGSQGVSGPTVRGELGKHRYEFAASSSGGLFVTMLLWRSGPIGFLHLLYTPTAMVLAQVVIAAPIVAGLTPCRHSTAQSQVAVANFSARRLACSACVVAAARGALASTKPR